MLGDRGVPHGHGKSNRHQRAESSPAGISALQNWRLWFKYTQSPFFSLVFCNPPLLMSDGGCSPSETQCHPTPEDPKRRASPWRGHEGRFSRCRPSRLQHHLRFRNYQLQGEGKSRTQTSLILERWETDGACGERKHRTTAGVNSIGLSGGNYRLHLSPAISSRLPCPHCLPILERMGRERTEIGTEKKSFYFPSVSLQTTHRAAHLRKGKSRQSQPGEVQNHLC